MRALIAQIGSDAGFAAEYWRDGVCFYDEKTASRALVEQRWTEGWAGEVHIATKRGQAGVLLQRPHLAWCTPKREARDGCRGEGGGT
jgi:hypothetical protein